MHIFSKRQGFLLLNLICVFFMTAVFYFKFFQKESDEDICLFLDLETHNCQYCVDSWSRYRDFFAVRTKDIGQDDVIQSRSFEVRNPKYSWQDLDLNTVFVLDEQNCLLENSSDFKAIGILPKVTHMPCWGINLGSASILKEHTSLLRVLVRLSKIPGEMKILPGLAYLESTEVTHRDINGWSHFKNPFAFDLRIGDLVYVDGKLRFSLGSDLAQGVEIERTQSITHRSDAWLSGGSKIMVLEVSPEIQLERQLAQRGSLLQTMRFETQNETLLQVDVIIKKLSHTERFPRLFFEVQGGLSDFKVEQVQVYTPRSVRIEKKLFVLGRKNYDQFVPAFDGVHLSRLLNMLSPLESFTDYLAHPELAKY